MTSEARPTTLPTAPEDARPAAGRWGRAANRYRAWRVRLDRHAVLAVAWRGLVFLVGLLLVVLGIVLSVLPGPLTIPPVLAGVALWATEFGWARRLFRRARQAGDRTWRQTREHPVRAGGAILAGLSGLVAVVVAVMHWRLLDRMSELVGL